MLPAVAVNAAVVAPATTVTEAETGSSELLLDRATEEPPVGADLDRVTVTEVAAPEFRLVGLHASDETSTGATRFTEAVFDWLLSVAVRVAV